MTRTMRRVRDATPFSKVVPLSEANVARLGLVCVQERIPEDYTHWKISYALEGREGEISCECGSEYGGVPHGVDGDFATALNMLYLEQGTPSSGLVETTAYQLIRYAGFEDSGYYYIRLSESLKRLRAAQYKVARVWKGGRGWQTTEFSYLNQIDSTSPEGRTVGRATLLSIRLADPVARSIRNNHLTPMDHQFLTSLNRPTTRALYRLLSAVRQDGESGAPLSEYRVMLSEWGTACKMPDRYPARIKRNLEDAHQELIRRGFLRAVLYEGRGKTAQVSYAFGDQVVLPPAVAMAAAASVAAIRSTLNEEVHSAVLEQLCQTGVSRTVAQQLLTSLGETQIVAGYTYFQSLLAGGYRAKNKAAFLVDVLRNPGGKYVYPTTLFPQETPPARPLSRPFQPELAPQMLEDLPLEHRCDELLVALRGVGFKLTVEQQTLLRQRVTQGQLHPSMVIKEAIEARKHKALDEYLKVLLEPSA